LATVRQRECDVDLDLNEGVEGEGKANWDASLAGADCRHVHLPNDPNAGV
jgi:hypothetical protein